MGVCWQNIPSCSGDVRLCSLQAFTCLGGAHPHFGGKSALLKFHQFRCSSHPKKSSQKCPVLCLTPSEHHDPATLTCKMNSHKRAVGWGSGASEPVGGRSSYPARVFFPHPGLYPLVSVSFAGLTCLPPRGSLSLVTKRPCLEKEVPWCVTKAIFLQTGQELL